MGGSDQEDIFKLFAALLHLGNIKFNPGSDEASISSATSAALAKAGELFQVRTDSTSAPESGGRNPIVP
jgi:myosin heavy subunit